MTTPKPRPDGVPARRIPVRYYRFSNSLLQKATGAGRVSGKAGFAEEALQAAEAEFQRMAEDYPDWVQGHIKRLYSVHQSCVDLPELRHQQFKSLNDIAHDMKGQGGTFGYPLISLLGDSLYNFTRPREEYSDREVDLAKAHIDAMAAVIGKRIAGKGGKLGQQIMLSLQKAIARYTAVE